MTFEAQMQRVGGIDAHGYDVYYAEEGRFVEPGLYISDDGKRNVCILSEQELRFRLRGEPVPAGLAEVLADAVSTDGAHHKQWYLEHIAGELGIDLPDHEPGIAP